MKYEKPNMQVVFLNTDDLVRTSVTEGDGIPEGDSGQWPR